MCWWTKGPAEITAIQHVYVASATVMHTVLMTFMRRFICGIFFRCFNVRAVRLTDIRQVSRIDRCIHRRHDKGERHDHDEHCPQVLYELGGMHDIDLAAFVNNQVTGSRFICVTPPVTGGSSPILTAVLQEPLFRHAPHASSAHDGPALQALSRMRPSRPRRR